MKKIALLGATGSVGCNVLAVIQKFSEQFSVVGLAAGRNVKRLAAQVIAHDPERISVQGKGEVAALKRLIPDRYHQRIRWGRTGAIEVAETESADMVISAMVGAVGLEPTLAAIQAGKDIGLANKETLVMAGRLVMSEAAAHHVHILPIDSEHSAVFQALEAGRREDVDHIILTASGGPFRQASLERLRQVTPTQALAHPNWDMGEKISIDSATMMNKGLEVIEARWLFDMGGERIKVVVHPQSIVHSLVEYIDGSVVAQLGIPDMQIPIAHALAYPARLPLGLQRLSLSQCGDLTFEQPDHIRFPALGLAYQALEAGGLVPAILNGANEVAVAAFLAGKIGFTAISQIAEETMAQVGSGDELALPAILAADKKAREVARLCIDRTYSTSILT